jgi:hypothetical protein
MVTTLAAASTYDKKYYLNPEFESLPDIIKEEIRIYSVSHVAEVGGMILIAFDEEGTLYIEVTADEFDILYDEIGSHLRVKRKQKEGQELFEGLEKYYRIKFLGLEE